MCLTGEGALAAYRWAWAFVLRGGERAFLLAVLLQLAALSIWVIYRSIGMMLPVGAIAGIVASLLWGQMFLFARMWVRT